jgi:isochorismate hydrolase
MLAHSMLTQAAQLNVILITNMQIYLIITVLFQSHHQLLFVSTIETSAKLSEQQVQQAAQAAATAQQAAATAQQAAAAATQQYIRMRRGF